MPSLSSAMQLRTAGTAIDQDERIGLMRRRGSMMSPCGQGAQLSFRTMGELPGRFPESADRQLERRCRPSAVPRREAGATSLPTGWAQGFRACYPDQGRAVLV